MLRRSLVRKSLKTSNYETAIRTIGQLNDVAVVSSRKIPRRSCHGEIELLALWES
jgi:hypothetical protein